MVLRRGSQSRQVANVRTVKTASGATAVEIVWSYRRNLPSGLGGPGLCGPLEIASSRIAHLWDALCRPYDALGFPAGHRT